MTDQNTVTTQPRQSIQDLSVSMELKGRVKRIELYGAFVDVGVGTDGLLHISQLGQQVRNVEDVLKPGDEVTVYVLRVDPAAGRIALSLQKPPAMSWDDIKEGMVVTGKVVKLEKFGAFVDFGAERPGMVHVSEMANGYVASPGDVLKEGEEVRAAVIKVNKQKRRIDLSIKAMEAPPEPVKIEATEPEEYVPNAMEIAFRRAYEAQGEDMPERDDRRRNDRDRRGGGGRKQDKRNRQREMDDIFERTLRGRN
ncbi:MAG: S1 RNA-binding domain-containing protein [bacterium]|nr:S1 RNA-binding domain-containing protein [bacterium]